MPSDKLHAVADEIRAIHGKLKDGICIIALQKQLERDTGRGDSFSIEKAKLYVALDSGRLKIVDAKASRNPRENHKGKVKEFDLLRGSIFQPCGNWRNEAEKEKKTAKK